MSEATARSGPNACAQEFIMARDATVTQRSGFNLSSMRLEVVVRGT
jgi:hypothetical protein